jgi:hypothetical protein
LIKNVSRQLKNLGIERKERKVGGWSAAAAAAAAAVHAPGQMTGDGSL